MGYIWDHISTGKLVHAKRERVARIVRTEAENANKTLVPHNPTQQLIRQAKAAKQRAVEIKDREAERKAIKREKYYTNKKRSEEILDALIDKYGNHPWKATQQEVAGLMEQHKKIFYN